ncbi:MAG: SURF1 family protein [Actinomycetota bacterium]
MVRTLLSPRWILTHLAVALLIFLMINLGFWQLRRLDEKKTFNAVLRSHTSAPLQTLDQAVPSGWNQKTSEWLRVRIIGTYDRKKAVTVINRSQDGSAGFDSVVPFTSIDHRTILVNRGFVPLAMPVPEVPTEQREIVGYLRASQSRSALGAIDSVAAGNTEFQRFDIPLISAHVGGTVEPMFLQLIEESPPANSQWPAKVALPPLDEGPHLSYALQWFFFCLVAFTAWVVVVRRKILQVNASTQEQTSA